jgi:thiosulfate dehydrogenase [quinone] large subunit
VDTWTGNGAALRAFWERAVTIPQPPARPPIAFDWYRDFIQYLLDVQAYTWFSKVVAYGEFLIGAAIIAGVFVGIIAFFAGFMNWNFMMAGTVSVNPVMFPLAVLLMLAWKVAGYYGLDRYLLRALGTPWQPGTLFSGRPRRAVLHSVPAKS